MDFGVLAGYMLILDPETCRKNVMINLHPALPDSYKGTWEEIVQKVVDNDDDRYGAMVHICTPELDRGDVLSYDSFDVRSLSDPSISKQELVERIRAKELKREAPLLIETIKMIVNGEIVLKGPKVKDRPEDAERPYRSLAERIDKIVEVDKN